MLLHIHTIIAALASGGLVGTVLGIVGGGGSILAVSLLVYVVGTNSPHVAIGTSAIAVSLSAVGNVVGHWRAGNVKWRSAAVFATVGVFAALGGASLAKAMNGQRLLALFGILMIVVGATMLRKRKTAGNPDVELYASNAASLLPWLIGIGATVLPGTLM